MPLPDHDDHAVFPLLADPAGYRACAWNLARDADRRAYWIGLFKGHFPRLLDEARRTAEATGNIVPRSPADTLDEALAMANDRFIGVLEQMELHAGTMDCLTILDICWEREKALYAAGLEDPYQTAKAEANAQAMQSLPAVLEQLDALSDDERGLALLQGVFAGNIYDLGATKTERMFRDGPVDFSQVRQELKARPWFVDGADAFIERWQGGGYRSACLFIDNAGCDILLGMLPFARALLQSGTRVILTANAEPSLNDVTLKDLEGLLAAVAEHDTVLPEALRDGRLMLVSSGNWAPLIDLTKVSVELAALVEREGVDLVVLEGMGRGVESNYDARLTVDTLKIAMIKDEGVASGIGAGLFDLVCKFEPCNLS